MYLISLFICFMQNLKICFLHFLEEHDFELIPSEAIIISYITLSYIHTAQYTVSSEQQD